MEFYKPAQGDTAATVAEGYDNNFKTLDTAVSDLETRNDDQNRQLGLLRDDVALKAYTADVETQDVATLAAAHDYADGLAEALRGSAPESLDTLRKLAAALGDDPNFSATVMQQLGERVTSAALNEALAAALAAALAGYLPLAGGTLTGDLKIKTGNGTLMAGRSGDVSFVNNYAGDDDLRTQLALWADGRITAWNYLSRTYHTLWHSGNQGTGSGLDADATDGLHFWKGTQAAYDALAVKDANTLYIVTD